VEERIYPIEGERKLDNIVWPCPLLNFRRRESSIAKFEEKRIFYC